MTILKNLIEREFKSNYYTIQIINDRILPIIKEWLTQKRRFYEEKLQDSEWIQMATTEEYNTVWERNNEIKELLEELK